MRLYYWYVIIGFLLPTKYNISINKNCETREKFQIFNITHQTLYYLLNFIKLLLITMIKKQFCL